MAVQLLSSKHPCYYGWLYYDWLLNAMCFLSGVFSYVCYKCTILISLIVFPHLQSPYIIMKGFPMQVNMAPTIASNKGVKSRCPKQKPIEEVSRSDLRPVWLPAWWPDEWSFVTLTLRLVYTDHRDGIPAPVSCYWMWLYCCLYTDSFQRILPLLQ